MGNRGILMKEELQESGLRVSRKSLEKLLDGNRRFLLGQRYHQNMDEELRKRTLNAQAPIAAILGCSDSRVAPEIVFDQGIGDIFVVRTAGNVLVIVGIGSMEYAVEHLHVPLIVVLGHQRCGAVSAALQGIESLGHVNSVIEKIAPAIEKSRNLVGDIVTNVVDTNVLHVVDQLRSCKPILSEMVKKEIVEVVGARYDLDTGRVVILEKTRQQQGSNVH